MIGEMARANRTWGEERIAAELLLKLGVSLSPRTVRRYMRRPPSAHPGSRTQTWSTFVHNLPVHQVSRNNHSNQA